MQLPWPIPVGTAPTFNTAVDVQMAMTNFLEEPSETMNTSKTMRNAALENAAIDYANALKDGQHVPDDVMKVMRTARDDMMFDDESTERQKIVQIILEELTNKNTKIIQLPNKIPPFLSPTVTDRTVEVQGMIDEMNINPHIAQHMKHSVGHYYNIESNPWTKEAVASLQAKLDAMAHEYRLLDDVVANGVGDEDADDASAAAAADDTGERRAHLAEVKYIIIPDVGATDDAITRRTADLDTLFAANPHLTLVIAFSDGVTTVGKYFCCDSARFMSTLSTNVKKLSFTGKNLQTVGNRFFYRAQALKSVDFRGLGALQTVGDEFFDGAHALMSVDLRGLSGLHTVGDGFFYDAQSLTSVDFRGLGALRTVGDYFFAFAQALTSVDFRGLSALHTVGSHFFAAALALTSVDFRGLSALYTVGDFFFGGARALTSVDFRGLGALHTVGDHFFLGADALTSMHVRNQTQAVLIRPQYEGPARIIVDVQPAARTAVPDAEGAAAAAGSTGS